LNLKWVRRGEGDDNRLRLESFEVVSVTKEEAEAAPSLETTRAAATLLARHASLSCVTEEPIVVTAVVPIVRPTPLRPLRLVQQASHSSASPISPRG